MKFRILLVEDDQRARRAIRKSFENLGHLVETATTISTAKKKLTGPPKYHAIIMDNGVVSPPDSRQVDYALAIEAVRTNPQAYMIAITGFINPQWAQEAQAFFDRIEAVSHKHTDSFAEDVEYALERDPIIDRTRKHIQDI